MFVLLVILTKQNNYRSWNCWKFAQRQWTKRIYGFENLTYSQRLKDVDLFSVKGWLLRADVIKCWKIFQSKCEISPEDIFVTARSGITRGNYFMVDHECFSLDCRRRSIALRVAHTWNSLPDNVVALETLISFKKAIRCCLNEK